VHLASVLALGAGETVLATWDRDLSNAAVDAGLAVAPALGVEVEPFGDRCAPLRVRVEKGLGPFYA
jgi:hypothetical protein